MACPGLPQSCGSPSRQQGPWVGLGRGRARTSWALQSPRSPSTVGNKLRKPRQDKSPNRQTPRLAPSPTLPSQFQLQSRQKNKLASGAPMGDPRGRKQTWQKPSWNLMAYIHSKGNKNDLASDQCREPRKQKHDPGDEKRNETSGGPSRNLLDVARQPKLAGRPTLAAGPWPSARLSPPQG